MNTPLVSIVIPCFNAQQWVADAIRSGLGQTYPHTEVIVIDDGSTDQSVEVLQSFGAAIRWEPGPNRGACAARNRGMELARGDLIQFLDADDWLYPHKLERQVAALNADPDATPVCDGEVIEAGQVVKRYTAPLSCQDSLIPLLNGQLPTPSPLHRKQTLEQVGGFLADLPCSQERDLHLRLASYGWPLQRVPESLYAVRRLPGSISSSYEKVLDQHLPIASRVLSILRQQGSWTDEKAISLAAFLTRDARQYVRIGRPEKATNYFSIAREYHPSGGWNMAYGRLTRIAARVIGPVNLERLLTAIR